MTETKHTPGPWVSFYKSKYDEWHVSLPMGKGQMKLALCPDGIQSENREGDARLIAAAPDLLEAAKAMMKRWPTDQISDSPFYDEALALRAAIAKATG